VRPPGVGAGDLASLLYSFLPFYALSQRKASGKMSAEQITMEDLLLRYTATCRLVSQESTGSTPPCLSGLKITPRECRKRACPRWAGCKRALYVSLVVGGAIIESMKCDGETENTFFHVDENALVHDIGRLMRQSSENSSVCLQLKPSPFGETVCIPIYHADHSYTAVAYLGLRDQRRWFPKGIGSPSTSDDTEDDRITWGVYLGRLFATETRQMIQRLHVPVGTDKDKPADS